LMYAQGGGFPAVLGVTAGFGAVILACAGFFWLVAQGRLRPSGLPAE